MTGILRRIQARGRGELPYNGEPYFCGESLGPLPFAATIVCRIRLGDGPKRQCVFSYPKMCIALYAVVMAKKVVPAGAREYLAEIGRKGGKIGGKAKSTTDKPKGLAALSPEQRSAIARKGAKARHASKDKK